MPSGDHKLKKQAAAPQPEEATSVGEEPTEEELARIEKFKNHLVEVHRSTPHEKHDALMGNIERHADRVAKSTLAQTVEKEEKKLQHLAKRVSKAIKESDEVGDLLQVSRITTLILWGYDIGRNFAYEGLNDALAAVSIVGIAVNIYRNGDKDLRRVIREEHRMRRKLHKEEQKAGSLAGKIEMKARLAASHLAEETQVFWEVMKVRYKNGRHGREGENASSAHHQK